MQELDGAMIVRLSEKKKEVRPPPLSDPANALPMDRLSGTLIY